VFWHIAALVYLALSAGGLYINIKMHRRFKASDELKKQNEQLLRLLAQERAKKT
jgi:hypothetical protein